MKPIIFSTPMVQAIVALLKWMTRRLTGLDKINEWPNRWVFDKFVEDAKGNLCARFYDTAEIMPVDIKFPYGKVGGILYVRETSAVTYSTGPKMKRTVWYRADDPVIPPNVKFKWKPSIHMLRGSARLFLKITDIRVERLQDIQPDDAAAEGIEFVTEDLSPHVNGPVRFYKDYSPGCGTFEHANPVESFQSLWYVINGVESWNSNPWVWVINFERIEKPV